MTATQSKNDYTLTLAKEIIDDIEQNRISGSSLVLKAARLAELAGSTEIQSWLRYERNGFNKTEPLSQKFLARTGRIINKQLDFVFYGSLASQESSVETASLRLRNLQPQEIQPNLGYSSRYTVSKSDALTMSMNHSLNIRNIVVSMIHDFARKIYHKKAFSGYTESIFEQFKSDVDSQLANSCGDVLEKVPSVYARLAEGDNEAISHALTTCRRIIDSFADAIYPPTEIPFTLDGNTIHLTAKHHLNRINAYIREHTESKSRRQKLRQSLSNLYERVSTGVHADVSFDEARSLFLETYLVLGEVLTLSN
jgi:hypothetical protein